MRLALVVAVGAATAPFLISICQGETMPGPGLLLIIGGGALGLGILSRLGC